MRIVFMGTPDFAVPTLSEIVGRGHEVVAVYTRAPAPAGRRGLDLTPSPVHQVAERFGLKVLTPKSLRSPEAAAEFAAHDADVAVVVAYGLILPPAILEAPRLGCLNLHGSLLPRWRGAAPIQRAIMAGDEATGVCVMQMEQGLDTGPVGLVERIPIGPDMTAGDLHDRMMVLGADLMARALAALERGGLAFTPQPEAGVAYAAKIEKAETRIDWSQPAQVVHDRIRGLSPFPGAWFPLGPEATRVKVLRSTLAEGAGAPGEVLDDRLTIACGSGAVRLVELQKAGKQPAGASSFLNGNAVPPGTRLA
ncbi:UNVERIFIED_ORG: methionyl-tRNA formyltransferase [Xanthobacter viscosus]|jgi:methionyl-tRNA formyltransferase|uniref:Methionyl-tRNA formyltransferase n=1 Tax=Xanthobacter autotrophicus TaxID=280 RepID=A0A6C1KBI2_XANAU|nr:methionyl-tRNA formyltransferase [Xanthobacter autotrophicus]TLX41510.1 methionyl-tRNA formyltransferase [Xanthobacter autotrophicus]